MNDHYAVAVQRGMRLLDEQCPGWSGRVDLAMLDLGEPCNCVLGQEFGNYEDGEAALALNAEARVAYGFDMVAYGFDIDADTATSLSAEYGLLTQAWQRAIRTRLEAERVGGMPLPGFGSDEEDAS